MKNAGVGCAFTAQLVSEIASVASKLATYTSRKAVRYPDHQATNTE
jgi:hypothetical protein